MNDKLTEIFTAEERYDEAAKALAAATAKAFPVGTILHVTLGKARVRGEVIGAGSMWHYQPARVVIRNLDTGKQREFSATYKGHDIEFEG